MEGSEFTIECIFNTSNNSTKWFVEWNKTRNNVTEKVCNETDRIILSADKGNRSLSLTVKKADVTDSGTYVCWIGIKDKTSPGNGTQVTIDEITDLMVNQTPTSFSDLEGSELTVNCTFRTVNNHSTMYVRWYNYGTEGLKKELVNDHNVITTLHLDNGFASLTLKNANSSNTGTYVCEVGSTARNLSGNGTGTNVTIDFPELMVNQTPATIHESEGSDLTMECRFTVWNKHNTLYVKWYKHNGTGGMKKEPISERGWGSAALDLEKGFASFTLKNVNVTDTGTYMCEVGSTARNRSESGAGTQVTITAVDLLVNQTLAVVNEEEGKQLTIECRFRAPEKPNTKYSVKWYKKGAGEHKKELKNKTGSITTTLDFKTGLASLTLTKASTNDSGFYICDFSKNGHGNGTRVTIHAVDLLVNQTPGVLNGSEGEKLTIECRFKVVKDSRIMYSVTWYKKGADGHEKELKNGTGMVTTALDSSKGLASLTLIKINRNDSGLYRCDFGKNGGGNGTRVTFNAPDKKPMNLYIVLGAAAGTLLFLLVLGILLWRWRQCSKEPLQSRSEAEMNQMETSPPPADDVTYVDLNFHKRAAKAEEEVVYTEVKIQPKQRDDNDIYAKVNPRHC
ncbi:polymeric immunoglobulin receptor-like isoform 2-T3 [Macrochelys suwanniensis]